MKTQTIPILVGLCALVGCSGGKTDSKAESSHQADTAPSDGTSSYAYTYDAPGLLTAVARDGVVSPVAPPMRDALGRATQHGGTALTYGADGQIAVATSGTVDVSYVYDETGERIAKASHGALVEGYVEGSLLTDDGLTEVTRVADRVVGVIQHGAFTSIGADTRGSVFTGTDGATTLASPFGDRASHPDVSRAIDYAAHGYDPDLGTVRLSVRDYDPHGGLFLEPDPLFLGKPAHCVESPVECNLYGYAKGNPLTFVDPGGRRVELAPGVSETYRKEYLAAVAYLEKSPTGKALMQSLQNDSHLVIIHPIQTAEERSNGSAFYHHPSPWPILSWFNWRERREIAWDPHMGVRESGGASISPALALAHEENHALQEIQHRKQFDKDVDAKDPTFTDLEEKRNIQGKEHTIATDLGEGLRVSHYGAMTTVSDPTKTK